MNTRPTRFAVIGVILLIALTAFEIFNFDTTQYALASFLGNVRFLGMTWASILAIAFCGIDFASLLHIFTPNIDAEPPPHLWLLTATWFLGATMNAAMTWYAVLLTLMAHPLGNELFSREQLLIAVPIFVAVLVWLTRILFIGALSIMGSGLLSDRLLPARHSLTGPQRAILREREDEQMTLA